jgi:hypothetical protein
MLPENTELGKIEIITVYDYYNMPMNFTAKNERNDLFLVTCMNENKTAFIWYYLPISEESHEALKHNYVDMRTAMLFPEYEYLYEVYTYFKSGYKDKIKIIAKPNELYLPEAGEYLNVELC